MTFVWQALLTLIAAGFLTVIVRAYSKVHRNRRLCDWLPKATLLPFLGALLEFRSLTETLNVMMRLTNNPSRLSYVELAYKPYIICRNYEFVEFMMSSNTLLDKSTDYQFFLPWLGTGLLTSTGSKWRKRRKVITPAFHFSILEQFVDIFDAHALTLVKKLERETLNKDSVDIYGYVTDCTLDVICETSMGVKIDSQLNKNQDYVFAVKDVCRLIMDRIFSAWRGVEFLFQFTKDHKKQQKYLRILHNFSNSVIEQRMSEMRENKNDSSIRKDEDAFGRKRKLAFLDLLLNSTVDGKQLSKEDVREEVDTFMFEGHDTTSSALSSALFLLAHHPEAQKLARHEQQAIFGSNKNRSITLQDLQEMKYLEMVIKETLRLYPSVPFVARFVAQDMPYKDHIIPRGTILAAFIYGIGRDPKNFENPEQFEPERFLDVAGKPAYSYIPFSAGPRNCIGQKFAMLEMKSVLSRVLQNFELIPTDPPHKMILSAEVILKSVNGVRIKLRKCDCW